MFINSGFMHDDMNLDPIGVMTNNTIIAAYGGNTVTLGGSFAFEADLDTIVNKGILFSISGGTLDIVATIHQSPGGMIVIDGGGKVVLDGNADGGCIVIEDGTLAWGRLTRGPAPMGSGTTSPIVFGQTSGAIDTGVVGITEVFNAVGQDIAVFSPDNGPFGQPPVQIADLHLAGRTYSAADFSVQGSAIVFNSIHATG